MIALNIIGVLFFIIVLVGGYTAMRLLLRLEKPKKDVEFKYLEIKMILLILYLMPIFQLI